MSDKRNKSSFDIGKTDSTGLADYARDLDGNVTLGALLKNFNAATSLVETNEEKAAEIAAVLDVGAERVDTDISNMYAKVQNVGEVWTGQDSDAFKDVFEDLKSRVNQNSSTLSDLAETIKREANITAMQNKEFTIKANNREQLY